MSTYYFLHCVTCNGLERTADRGPGRINHGAEYLVAIIPALPLLVPLAKFELEIRLERGDDRCIMDFAVRHAGHDVRVMDEYGRFWTQCPEQVRCVCGRWENCQFDEGHEGDHAPLRDAP